MSPGRPAVAFPDQEKEKDASDIWERLESDIEVLAIESLRVDHAHYQRPLVRSRIDKIAKEFDLAACGVIAVNRRSDGSLFIVDGQHRALGARKAGENEVLAQVFNGLTIQQEARLFRLKNAEHGPMKALNTFRAAKAEGQPEALAVSATVERLGGQINERIGESGIAAVGALLSVYRAPRNGGTDGLYDTLETLHKALGDLKGHNANGELIRAVHHFLTVHSDDDGMDRKRLISVLKKHGADGIAAKAGLERQLGGGGFRAWYRAILRVYNSGRATANRLDEKNR